jgi:hypothetical protein
MTLIEYFEAGYIKELYTKGAISVNFMTYFRYYQVWKAYLDRGNNKNKSYEFAADECGCCKRTIQTAVKVLTEQ